MSTIKIKVEDTNLYYGDHQALKDINIDIYEKAVTALIGPSGCGKSTFLRCLNRMNDLIPNVRRDGKIEIAGTNVDKYDVILLRKKVGMVFQKPNPFPISIYENVAYGPRIHGVKSKPVLDDIVEKSLKEAALWDEVKDRLKNNAVGLSGGQQQRAAIARALCMKPSIIFADEPTGNLDTKSSNEVMELFKNSVKKYNQTLVMITHNPEISKFADRVLFIEDGMVSNGKVIG
ncbi:MAG TPA: phosphate ABC transporter ATP-binding protein [Clostridiaceae bacterium]|nr:phosphate ABC transporter ATP-binding protein [Clostridiaceae bacterium]